VIPAVVLLAELVAALPILIMASAMGKMVSQFGVPKAPGMGLLWVFFGFVWFLPTLAVLVAVIAGYLNSEVTLTSKRLIYRTGLLSRASGELPLENVDALFIQEPLLGRLFGFGTVAVSSVGGAQFPFRYIGQPQMLHSMLQRAVKDAKAPRRSVPPAGPQDDSRYMPKA
jgi:uncharacterized membrane protein YdbT with pleckstrin-like domain